MMDQEHKDMQNLVAELRLDDQPDSEYRQDLREKLLNQFDASPTRNKKSFRILHQTFTRYAAAAVVVLAFGAAIFMMTVGQGPSIAFADVQRQIREAKTISCILEMTGKATVYCESGEVITKTVIVDDKGNVVEEKVEKKALGNDELKERVTDIHLRMKILTKQPNLTRVDVLEEGFGGPAGTYTIVDSQNGTMAQFYPTLKLYYMGDTKVAASSVANFEDIFRGAMEKIKTSKAKPLGETTIDGRKANGYKLEDGVVWADAKTAEPIQIQFDNKDKNGNVSKVTISNIQINPPLDDSMFSMDIPEGYKDINDFSVEDAKKLGNGNCEFEIHTPAVTGK